MAVGVGGEKIAEEDELGERKFEVNAEGGDEGEQGKEEPAGEGGDAVQPDAVERARDDEDETLEFGDD